MEKRHHQPGMGMELHELVKPHYQPEMEMELHYQLEMEQPHHQPHDYNSSSLFQGKMVPSLSVCTLCKSNRLK